jgi:hypothetical protein
VGTKGREWPCGYRFARSFASTHRRLNCPTGVDWKGLSDRPGLGHDLSVTDTLGRDDASLQAFTQSNTGCQGLLCRSHDHVVEALHHHCEEKRGEGVPFLSPRLFQINPPATPLTRNPGGGGGEEGANYVDLTLTKPELG